MDENGTKHNLTEGLWGMVFLFLILVGLLYTFGNSKKEIKNQEIPKPLTFEEKEKLLQELKTENNSDFFNSYIDKIFQSNKDENKNDSEALAADFQDKLLQKTVLPEQNVTLKNVDASILGNSSNNKSVYLNELERFFAEFKKEGGTNENKIFRAQVADANNVLPLSNYDKETLLFLADKYEIYAQQVINLKTPKFYEDKSKSLAIYLLNVSFILKQMAKEEDVKVYPLWISKYGEVWFDIIANRYVR